LGGCCQDQNLILLSLDQSGDYISNISDISTRKMNKAHEPIYEIIQEPDVESHSELGRLWGIVLDERRLIAVIIAVFFVAGVLNALFTTPVYKADALLQVEPKSKGMPGLGELTGAFEIDSEAITEIEVLKSRMVMGRVVDELNLDIAVRRNYMALVGNGISRMLGDGGRAGFSALFPSYAWDDETIHVARLDMPDSLIGEELELVADDKHAYQLFYDGNLLLTGQVGVLAEGNGVRVLVTDLTQRNRLKFFLMRESKLAAIRNLQDNISVSENGRNSGILTVSLQGTDSTLTRKILDSVARQYLMQNVQRMSAEAENSLKFLQQQLPDVQTKLTGAESILNNYRLKNQSVDLSLETQSILDQMVKLEEQLNDLTLEETKVKKLFTPEHPYYAALLDKRKALTTEKEKLQQKIKELPETQQEILRLTRDVQVNQSIYVEMLNKEQELSIVKAGTVGNVRILDTAALLDKPVKPRRLRVVLVSLILGLLLGVAVAVIRVSLRHGIKSPEELEAIGIPVFAVVPMSEIQQNITRNALRRVRHKGLLRRSLTGKEDGEKVPSDEDDDLSKSCLLAQAAPDDIAIEALRSLRTSMHFAMMETDKKVLMISGPGQNLGKSFISANLGAVYAKSNKKVLVIDCDLRKGHMHRTFNTDRVNGLSDLLAGQISREQAIKQTEIENLHFLSSGTVPPNPAEVLMHKNMQEFLQWAEKEYELVIVDTPPVLAVTDATIVGRYVGVTMLVARFEDTQKKEVELAIRRCEQSGISVKGCILNGVIHRHASEYGYGYSGYTQYKYQDDKTL